MNFASGQKEQLLLDELLRHLKELKLLKERGQPRTDSTHILGAGRQINRIEIIGETLRQALNAPSEFAPEWVKGIAKSEWFMRYGGRFEQMRLPKKQAERDALLVMIGEDGAFLLEAERTAAEGSEQLRQLPGVEFLRRMWIQQYWLEVREDGSAQLHIRGDDNQPSHEALQRVRREQNSPAFWERYAQRCGIEGTFSQAVRRYGLRVARYIGLAKTNLQMVATSTKSQN